MIKLEAGTVEASHAKHIPVVSVDGKIVTVMNGSADYPIISEHSIIWVYLQIDKGGQRKRLEVDKASTLTFALADEKPIAALHTAIFTDCGRQTSSKEELNYDEFKSTRAVKSADK